MNQQKTIILDRKSLSMKNHSVLNTNIKPLIYIPEKSTINVSFVGVIQTYLQLKILFI